jgi:hypothetical protein
MKIDITPQEARAGQELLNIALKAVGTQAAHAVLVLHQKFQAVIEAEAKTPPQIDGLPTLEQREAMANANGTPLPPTPPFAKRNGAGKPARR